jgi:hypothetical protein
MIESMISRKHESKIEIKQSFKIAIWKQRKLYGWID